MSKNNFSVSIYDFDGYNLTKNVNRLITEYSEEVTIDNPEYARISNIVSQWIINGIFKSYTSDNDYTNMRTDLRRLLVHNGYVNSFHFLTNEDYPLSDWVEAIMIQDEWEDYYLIYRIVDYGYQSDVSIVKLNCDDSTFFGLLRDMYITIGDQTFDNCYDGYYYLKYNDATSDYDHDNQLDPDDIVNLINSYINDHPDYKIGVYGDQYGLFIK